MVLAATTHFHPGGFDPQVWLPLVIGAWAVIPALVIRGCPRCSNRSNRCEC